MLRVFIAVLYFKMESFHAGLLSGAVVEALA